MPNELLDLNIGQVQAVIDGYSDRMLDENINAIWTGYYASYYFGKHPKKPADIIKKLLNEHYKSKSSKCATKASVDMDAELDLIAKRDLAFLKARGGKL